LHHRCVADTPFQGRSPTPRSPGRAILLGGLAAGRHRHRYRADRARGVQAQRPASCAATTAPSSTSRSSAARSRAAPSACRRSRPGSAISCATASSASWCSSGHEQRWKGLPRTCRPAREARDQCGRQGTARARRAAIPDGAAVSGAAPGVPQAQAAILKTAFMQGETPIPTICARAALMKIDVKPALGRRDCEDRGAHRQRPPPAVVARYNAIHAREVGASIRLRHRRELGNPRPANGARVYTAVAARSASHIRKSLHRLAHLLHHRRRAR